MNHVPRRQSSPEPEWPPRGVLNARKLDQVDDFFMPFDLGVAGFDDAWWDIQVGRVGASHYDWLSFVCDDEEVARAEVDFAATLGGDYVGAPLPRDVVDVTFLEVREDRRAEGIGRRAVELIVDRYRDRLLIAFSEDADKFWSAIGWRRFPRVDGSRLHRPLFVWDGRNS